MITLFHRARSIVEQIPLSVIQLAMRVGVGAVFFNAGLLKYRSWEFTLLLFRDEYQVPLLDPALAARMAMVQELTIPLLLFVGLGTRLAAIPLLGMIGVIQVFVFPGAWVEHLVWSSILVFLVSRGPGAISFDHLIARRFVGTTGTPTSATAATSLSS